MDDNNWKKDYKTHYQQDFFDITEQKSPKNNQVYLIDGSKTKSALLLPTKVVIGKTQEIYFAWKTELQNEYNISVLRRDSDSQENNLQVKQIYQTQDQILCFSYQNETFTKLNSQETEFKLLIFHSGKKYISYSQLGNGYDEWKSQPLKMVPNEKIDMLEKQLQKVAFMDILLEASAITTTSYNLGDHEMGSCNQIVRLSLESGLSIPGGLSISQGNNKEDQIFSIKSCHDVQRDIFELKVNSKKYFHLFQRCSLRELPLLSQLCCQQLVQKLVLSDERIFIICNNARTLQFLDTSCFCLEIERRSMMLVKCHEQVYDVEISQYTPNGPQYALMHKNSICNKFSRFESLPTIVNGKQENPRSKAWIQRLNQICKQCTRESKVMPGSSNCDDFKEKEAEMKRFYLENQKETSNQRIKISDKYILSENGQLIYIYIKQRPNFSNFQWYNLKNRENPVKTITITEEETSNIKDNPFQKQYCIESDLFNHYPKSLENNYNVVLQNQTVVIQFDMRIVFFSRDNFKAKNGKKLTFEVKEVPLSSLSDFSSAKSLHISKVWKTNFKFHDSRRRSKDLIQISYENKSFIWNLIDNQEVNSLINPENFYNIKNFINTGYSLVKIGDKKIQELQATRQHDSFVIPYDFDEQLIGHYFRPYTLLDLREINALSSQPQLSDGVSDSAMVSEVFGKSIFEQLFFSKDMQLQKVAEDQIVRMVDEYKDIETVEAKNLFRNVSMLILRPTTKNFSLLDSKEEKDQFKKLEDNESLRQQYRRNIIQMSLKFVVQSEHYQNDTSIKEEDEIRQRQKCELVQKKIEIFFRLFCDKKSSKIDLSQTICSVPEFWQVFCKMSDLKHTTIFLKNWRKSVVLRTIEFQWNESQKLINFGTFTSNIDDDYIKEQIRKKQITSYLQKLIRYLEKSKIGKNSLFKKVITGPLKYLASHKQCRTRYRMQELLIRLYHIDWLLGDEKMIYDLLAEYDETDLYQEQFIEDLLLNHNLTAELFVKAFLPYFIFMGSTVFYYQNIVGKMVDQDGEFTPRPVQKYICWSLMGVTMVVLQRLEFEQMIEKGLYYLGDPWNLVMFLSNVLVIYSIYNDCIQHIDLLTALMSSVSTFLIMIQMFYWTQMFLEVAMYWRIINEAVADSMQFIVTVMLLLLSFGFAVYTLDQNQQSLYRMGSPEMHPNLEEDYQELVGEKVHIESLDSFLSQYLLMLGEFELVGFEKLDSFPIISQVLLWFYFFAATFITQVVFFNVLVAVMSEAYSTRWLKKDAYALQQRTQIYSDYIRHLDTQMPQYRFYYVITQKRGGDDDDDIQLSNRTIEFISNLAETQLEDQTRVESLQKDFRRVEDSIATQQNEIQEMKKLLQQIANGLKKD